MPFLKVQAQHTWTHAGRMYRAGVHEVEEHVAARVRELKAIRKWGWMTVHNAEPTPLGDHAVAETGPLTVEDVKHGSEKAKELLAEAAALAALPTPPHEPKHDLAASVDPYDCTDEECDAAFPTEAARDRHVDMNHNDAAPAATEADEPVVDEPETPADDAAAELAEDAETEAENEE